MGALNGPALAGRVLCSYTCIFRQEEEKHSPLPAPLPASGRQMVTEAGRHHTDQRVTFLNTPSHTGTNLLAFIRKGFSSCAGLGKLCCSVTDLFAYRPQRRRQANRHSSSEHCPCCLEGHLISFRCVLSSNFSH